ncbi:diaminobutyrate acetyltransferase [Acidimangrovimonas pyrenivorans]|uniref:L-2,4-diaminobutyric acid acetyltransferase n=1 Tax=Acidimangrovimonas pyrenivorans TaxID=2030798 RepID=A0ABV7AFW4_9RHOB
MRHSLEFFRATGPVLRKPAAEDGAAIWKLVQACKPLDENSVYCNLIQCDHFRDTCVLAEEDGKVVGWISAYILPYDPQTVFVWQVAVAEEARGTGLGGKMLKHLLGRKELKDVTRLQTTITESNKASWALFKRFAQREGGELDNQAHFTRDTHFRGMAPTEHMVTISLPRRVKQAA